MHRVTILARKPGNVCSSICHCLTQWRLLLRRGGVLQCRPLPTSTRGSSSGVIQINVNGTAAIGGWLMRGGELRDVEHATWLYHVITTRAHAPLIVFILVQAFRGKPTDPMIGRPSWWIVSIFLWQGYFLVTFNTLFELNSVPSTVMVTSNNCEMAMARIYAYFCYVFAHLRLFE